MKNRLLILLAVCLLGGCSVLRKEPQASERPAAHTATVAEDVAAAHHSLDMCFPFLTGLGKAYGADALWSIEQAESNFKSLYSSNDKLEKLYRDQQDENAKILSDPWVKWALRLKRISWLIFALVAIHYVCGALALVPAFGAAGPILAMVSKIVNPLGWLSWLIEAKKPAVVA